MLSPRRKRLLVGLGAAALAAGLPLSQAAAATAITTFSVTANVVTTCSITATNLNFGSYSGVQLDGTATLTTTCSTGTPHYIQLHAGTAPGATTTTRKMTGPGAQLLAYGLFRNPARTLSWGEIVPTDAQFGVGSRTFTVFGRIPAGQFVQSGAYSDTISVELSSERRKPPVHFALAGRPLWVEGGHWTRGGKQTLVRPDVTASWR